MSTNAEQTPTAVMLMLLVLTSREATTAPVKLDMMGMERTALVTSIFIK